MEDQQAANHKDSVPAGLAVGQDQSQETPQISRLEAPRVGPRHFRCLGMRQGAAHEQRGKLREPRVPDVFLLLPEQDQALPSFLLIASSVDSVVYSRLSQ